MAARFGGEPMARDTESMLVERTPDVPPSSASHHWRVLREAGVLLARRERRVILHTLRREDLDGRFPGLLDAVLTATRCVDPDGVDPDGADPDGADPDGGPGGPRS